MKVKVILSVITIMVGATVFGFFQAYQGHAEQDLDRSDQAEILDATLQIKISVPLDTNGKRIVEAEGLGSLVWDGEKTLLVTHNHWGEVLQEKSQVVLYDAQGRMLKTMSGSEFISLMLYLDAGSLILRSPLEGVEQAQVVNAGDPLQVQVGDVLLVAQRVGSEREKAAMVEAEVESITAIRGAPVIRLKGSDGHPVQVGDSGGGVWHNGKLVGNLWYTAIAQSTGSSLFSWLRLDNANVEATDKSYAALFPAEPLKAFQESPISDVERETSGVP